MSRVELTQSVDVAAPPETVWRAAMDWQRQGEWIPATRVRLTHGDGRSVGSRVAARTGWGPLSFLDTMEITVWQPPRRCKVRHTGRLVRGLGVFSVVPRGRDEATFVWTELLDLPFGALGRWGWPIARPAFAAGVHLALRRFARFSQRYP